MLVSLIFKDNYIRQVSNSFLTSYFNYFIAYYHFYGLGDSIVNLTNIDATIFDELVKIIQNDIIICNEMMPDIIVAADFLQCDIILEKCIEEILVINNINIIQDIQIFNILFSFQQNSPKLFYLLVKNHKKLEELPIEMMDERNFSTLISSHFFNPPIDTITTLIDQWLSKNESSINLFLRTTVPKTKYFSYHVINKNIIKKITIATTTLQFFTSQKYVLTDYLPSSVINYNENCIFVFNNQVENFTSQGLLINEKNESFKLPPLLAPRIHYTTFIYNDNIYTFGGIFKNIRSFSVECYNIITKERKLLASLPIAVIDASVTVHNDFIYVIGGVIKEKVNTVQVYDIKNDKWKPVSPTNHPSSKSTTLTYDGKVIVIHDNFIEFYNPSLGEWKIVKYNNINLTNIFYDNDGIYACYCNNNNEYKIDLIYK
uniref:BACK domain-containing protein n=1 Tax=Strongyloides stercoralis TaxID=6248 RepID=A0A0K0E7U2_STRER